MVTGSHAKHCRQWRVLLVGDPDQIVLFGSRTRGDARRDFDPDLLVVEPSDLPRFRRPTRYRHALRELRPSKDLIVWTPEEVADGSNVPNAFIADAPGEARVLESRPDSSGSRPRRRTGSLTRKLSGTPMGDALRIGFRMSEPRMPRRRAT